MTWTLLLMSFAIILIFTCLFAW